MTRSAITCSKTVYQSWWPHNHREPIRPKDLRVLNFDQLFDWQNLWYDAVQVNINTILLVGPPLYQTSQFLKNTCFISANDAIAPYSFHEMDRACVTAVTVSGIVDQLILKSYGHSIPIQVNQQSNMFENQRVIVTISQDHPIEWLKQWIDYHYQVHDITGFLLYNNQSKNYTSDELQNLLDRDDLTIQVVDWPYPFGVMGGGDWTDGDRSGTSLPWDSDYAQYVMLEHAKYRFLYNAKTVINADTDELLLVNNWDWIENEFENTETCVLSYNGTWIEPIDLSGNSAHTTSIQNRKFSDYVLTENNSHRGISRKWMLKPSKCLQTQWGLHDVQAITNKTDQIGFGHFLAMNTSWSYTRDHYDGNRENLVQMPLLVDHLNRWTQHI